MNSNNHANCYWGEQAHNKKTQTNDKSKYFCEWQLNDIIYREKPTMNNTIRMINTIWLLKTAK